MWWKDKDVLRVIWGGDRQTLWRGDLKAEMEMKCRSEPHEKIQLQGWRQVGCISQSGIISAALKSLRADSRHSQGSGFPAMDQAFQSR